MSHIFLSQSNIYSICKTCHRVPRHSRNYFEFTEAIATNKPLTVVTPMDFILKTNLNSSQGSGVALRPICIIDNYWIDCHVNITDQIKHTQTQSLDEYWVTSDDSINKNTTASIIRLHQLEFISNPTYHALTWLDQTTHEQERNIAEDPDSYSLLQ